MSEKPLPPDGISPYADARGREYFFDNAKFLLILMVVTGHLISPLKSGNHALAGLWLPMNAMHMPCFVFLAGFFAKSFIRDGIVRTQRLVRYAVCYLWAQLLVMAGEHFIEGKDFSPNLLLPRGFMWFLMCLVVWNAALPYLYRFRPASLLAGSLVAALAAGYEARGGFAFMRAVSFFPFFLAGWCFPKDWFFRFRRPLFQCAAVAAVAAGIGALARFPGIFTGKLLSGAYNYLACGADKFFPEPLWFLQRLAWYAMAVLLGASFLLLVPRRKLFFTGLGARTLQVYILHRFVYLAETQYGLASHFTGPAGGTAIVLVAVVVTFLLSLRVFAYPFEWINKLEFPVLQGPPPTRM